MYSMNLRERLPRNMQQRIDDAVRPKAQKRGFRIGDFVAILKNILRWFADWRRRRNELRKLQALSDRNLKDIGLKRNEVTSSIERLIEFETRPKFNRQR
ncbi:MAG: DUF1127 domain-containing protein [Alphaproteobacteria bacterium]|nr:MAG: DUF1127 domain-containing protein [Alphaproteobacteria bacterium]